MYAPTLSHQQISAAHQSNERCHGARTSFLRTTGSPICCAGTVERPSAQELDFSNWACEDLSIWASNKAGNAICLSQVPQDEAKRWLELQRSCLGHVQTPDAKAWLLATLGEFSAVDSDAWKHFKVLFQGGVCTPFIKFVSKLPNFPVQASCSLCHDRAEKDWSGSQHIFQLILTTFDNIVLSVDHGLHDWPLKFLQLTLQACIIGCVSKPCTPGEHQNSW